MVVQRKVGHGQEEIFACDSGLKGGKCVCAAAVLKQMYIRPFCRYDKRP